MSLSKVYNQLTQKSVGVPLIADKDKPEYPSEVLHEGKTIGLVIPNYNGTLQALARAVRHGIDKNKLSCDVAKVYLYCYFKEIKEQLDHNWVSFGITIGAKGQTITPFNIFTVTRAGEITLGESAEADESDYLWMAIYLLVAYRVGRATKGDYKSKIAEASERVLKAAKPSAPKYQASWGSSDQWINDINYCKIVAGIDMFFFKFKNNTAAICRIGTITSRYRDAAALISLNHLRKICDGDLTMGLTWIFCPAVSVEFDRLAKEGQEVEENFSFTPYIIDLQISRLSPYSTTQNPGVHLFIHATGTFLLKRRSIDARMSDCTGEAGIIKNAGLLAFVVNSKMDWKLIYSDGPKEEKQGARGLLAAIDRKSEDLPEGREAADWYKWLKKKDFQLPEVVIKFMKDQASRIVNPRQDSVGEKIQIMYGD
ncbi:nucleoprotein [Harrison Dam virus]|uniref:Nucleoprotein n=1 Tax=Harrison Dam virus TaxID=1569259 RepID=A0A0A0V3A8_9RHAB|nr:nucleoprotein [Harrison Dam virus]AIW61118.1 nucleoprotein [Harrison Dam virus]